MRFSNGFLKWYFLFGCLLLSFSVWAQYDSGLYWRLNVGASYAAGEHISKSYGLGGRFSTDISIPILKARLRINPIISLYYFGSYRDKGTRDNLPYWNLGGEIELNHKVDKDVCFVPILGVYYLTGKDYLTPRKGYKGEKYDLFSFNGVGFTTGFRLYAGQGLSLTIALDLVSPAGKLSEKRVQEIKDQLNANSTLYDLITIPDIRMSFNTIHISLGYKFPIR